MQETLLLKIFSFEAKDKLVRDTLYFREREEELLA